MANYQDCIDQLVKAAGRALTTEEIDAIYMGIHKAALDIKAGRDASGRQLDLGLGNEETGNIFQKAAIRAAKEMIDDADNVERQANLQVLKLGARLDDFNKIIEFGVNPIDSARFLLRRDYSGQFKRVSSLEEKASGWKSYFSKELGPAWEALGSDFLGFFQDKTKLLDLVKEIRGEDSGNPLAKKGAQVWAKVAEEMRTTFNSFGGVVGKLLDWGMPQHHSQAKVSYAGNSKDPLVNQKAWVDYILPLLDRKRYVDDIGNVRDDAWMHDFLEHAWTTIATDGHANIEPGEPAGFGKRANRHSEERMLHLKDAESQIAYWDKFGDMPITEILNSHVDTMAKDIAFVEHFGPNADMTWNTLRDAAARFATAADPAATPMLKGRLVELDNLYDYAAGKTKGTESPTLSGVADGVANVNGAAKGGAFTVMSAIGDRPMVEAVSHLDNLPFFSRWRDTLSLFNPFNKEDRRILQTQGLMLDYTRSGLQRFYEGLGKSSFTGKLYNANMRVTGMTAVNELPKAAFGITLMKSIADQIKDGKNFHDLDSSDSRFLRVYGFTEKDWNTWKLAPLEATRKIDSEALTPASISKITDQQLKDAGIIGAEAGPEEAHAARRDAIVRLLGAVNTESEFGIVSPGWQERADFYAGVQRGTIKGEITRSVMQFKIFPWTQWHRMMDAVANKDGPVTKAIMASSLFVGMTLAGAMIMTIKDLIAGRDPRDMTGQQGSNKMELAKFWSAAVIQGGAMAMYGDFLYGANQNRFGSGIIENLSGPTMGPLLELGLVHPMEYARNKMDNKPTHLGAQTIQTAKGFTPFASIWYARAAFDHLIWQRAMEAASPGYLANIRAKAQKDYHQQFFWAPSNAPITSPANWPTRAPDFEKAIGR